MGGRAGPVPSLAPWSPSGCSRFSTTPPPWPSASRPPATACTWWAAASGTPSWAGPSSRRRPRLHHRRPPRRHRSRPPGLGRQHLGPGPALRHHRRPEGRPRVRDHHPPGRGLHARLPQARRRLRRRGRGRPGPPRLHRQRHGPRAAAPAGDGASPPSSSTPSAGWPTWSPTGCARPCPPTSRSPTTPCACCGRPGSSPATAWLPDPELVDAVRRLRGRLEIVSAERIRGELDKLMVVDEPGEGLWFLVNTGLSDEFLPELSGLSLEQDPIHRHKDVLAHTIAVVEKTSPDKILRLAALLHDIGKPKTRSIGPGGVSFHHHEVVGARMADTRLRALRYPMDEIADITRLVELHLRFHGFGTGWSDSAVRRYARDAGPLLEKLNELTRCDCHHPQQAAGRRAGPADGPARGAHRRPPGAGGARLHPSRPRRQPDHGAARHRSQPRRGPGPRLPPRAAPGGGPPRRGRGPPPPRRLVGGATRPRTGDVSRSPGRPIRVTSFARPAPTGDVRGRQDARIVTSSPAVGPRTRVASSQRARGASSRRSERVDTPGVLPSQLLAEAIDGRATSRPASCASPGRASSRPASTCASARAPTASGAASCPGDDTVERKVKDYVIDELDLRRDGRRPRDQPAVPDPAGGAAAPARRTSGARPTRRAPPAGSTSSPGSSPTTATASTRSRPATTAPSTSRSSPSRSPSG